MATTYRINGMHCGACVQRIQTALAPVVDMVSVTLDPPRLVVPSDNVNFDTLNKAVAGAGNYSLSPLDVGAPTIMASVPADVPVSWVKTYYPLFLIVGLISFASLRGAENIHDWMIHFMAGFFIVFGFFKLLDLRGFRDAYATYDLLAARSPAYGFMYPFLELALGFAFLFQVQLPLVLFATILLMGFGSLGVIRALRRKQKIRCACLGTVLNLPMSTITLVEDLGMVAMSVVMLIGLAV